MTKLPVVFTVPPITVEPAFLSTGIGSPVIIASSTALPPSTTVPSTGTFSPGRTPRRSPTCTASSGISSSRPSVDAPCSARAEIEKRADCPARPPSRLQLEHLAHEHERHDHRGRLEVDGHHSVVATERRREDAGRERRDDAFDVRRRRYRSRSA
jgi:hypothetical protein